MSNPTIPSDRVKFEDPPTILSIFDHQILSTQIQYHRYPMSFVHADVKIVELSQKVSEPEKKIWIFMLFLKKNNTTSAAGGKARNAEAISKRH